MISQTELESLIRDPEGRRLECKKAENRFDFERLAQYAAALANEGGGYVLLGVSDQRPREVIGTAAFPEPGRQSASLFERLRLRVDGAEFTIDGKRVLVFEVPSRSAGHAVSLNGTYWMRAGEALVPMSDERLREIHQELDPDFSAEICDGLEMDGLDREAIEEFRARWIARSENGRLGSLSAAELLQAADLVTGDGSITYAALLLLGTSAAVRQHLPDAELIYEYRSSEAAGPAQDRVEFRQGFLLTSELLWDRINTRNDRQSIQEGFFRREIPTFDEATIREGILNAISHRDYRSRRSVLVVQYPRRMEVISPGGLPQGVTPDNILSQHHPRNRRLAEAMNRIGLVERAGQGVNVMFERSLQQGKPLPDYSGSSGHEVRLVLDGLVTNPALLAMLEKIEAETLQSFAAEDFLILDCLQRGEEIPVALRPRALHLHELGLIERSGRGRSTRYFLGQRVSTAIGQRGTHTRRRGLGRAASRALLLQHLKSVGAEGSNLTELRQVLHTLSRGQVQDLLQSMKSEGLVTVSGVRRWARWFHAETPL